MKTVLVVFGGRSVEHDISIITGQFILAALQATGEFVPVPLYIAKDGRWYSEPELAKLETFQNPSFQEHLKKLRPSVTEPGTQALVKSGFRAKRQHVDVVFPALHGTYGEDGSLAGFLRLFDAPFVGCDVAASAIAMDKVTCKLVTEAAGVPSVPYVWFTGRQWVSDRTRLEAGIWKLHHPLFVKPAHLGSSIGVSRVDSKQDLENAVEVALHYDDKVLVEQGVAELQEINCAVLGNDELTLSDLEEPLTKTDFLSFEDKYVGGGKKGGSMSGAKSHVNIPAPVSATMKQTVQEYTATAFRAIGGSGISRLDFLVDTKARKVYLNEINPLPGNLQEHLWKASGVSNSELVTRLVQLAEERFAQQQQRTTMFESSVLQQPGGLKNGSDG